MPKAKVKSPEEFAVTLVCDTTDSIGLWPYAMVTIVKARAGELLRLRELTALVSEIQGFYCVELFTWETKFGDFKLGAAPTALVLSKDAPWLATKKPKEFQAEKVETPTILLQNDGVLWKANTGSAMTETAQLTWEDIEKIAAGVVPFDFVEDILPG